jgi:hypothetical protein
MRHTANGSQSLTSFANACARAVSPRATARRSTISARRPQHVRVERCQQRIDGGDAAIEQCDASDVGQREEVARLVGENLAPRCFRFLDATAKQRPMMEQDLAKLEPRIDVIRIPCEDPAIGTLGTSRVARTPLTEGLE